MTGRLCIRADAGPDVGAGHVMRCLALAQAWREAGGAAVFLLPRDLPWVEERITTEGFALAHVPVRPGTEADAKWTAEAALECHADWLILDAYRFGPEYRRRLTERFEQLVLIDDDGQPDGLAQVIVNQNLHAHQGLYPHCPSTTRMFLGPRYALLRREFWAWRDWRRAIAARARRVLVTLGAGRAETTLLKVLDGVRGVPVQGLSVRLVAGPLSQDAALVRQATAALDGRLEVVEGFSKMPDLMAEADLAVSGGGSTCWELAFMGLPAVTLALADNQRAIACALAAAGATVSLGWHEQVTQAEVTRAIEWLVSAPDVRADLSRRGRELVDGQGARRVAAALMGAARADDAHSLSR